MTYPAASPDPVSSHVSEFSLRVPSSRQVTYPLFQRALGDVIDQIAAVRGEQDSLSRYLRENSPEPMRPGDWNKFYAAYNPPGHYSEKGGIEIRPDLVQYPVLLLASVAHEATHALDPLIVRAVELRDRMNGLHPDHPLFSISARQVVQLGYKSEIAATDSELEILPRAKVPRELTTAQHEYFEQERSAMIAFRERVRASNQARLGVTEFAETAIEVYEKLHPAQINSGDPRPWQVMIGGLFLLADESPVLTPSWNQKAAYCVQMFEQLVHTRPNAWTLGDTMPRAIAQSKVLLQTLKQGADTMLRNAELAAKRRMPPLQVIEER